jgi:rare lipoprotein A
MMAGFVVWRCSSVRAALVAGLLALLTGCATLPGSAGSPQTSSTPLTPLTPAEVAVEPVAKVVLPSTPSMSSRLAAFAQRLFKSKKSQAPVFIPAPDPAPESDHVVDEKYQLTGDTAVEVERGDASWYGGRFHGQRTANGERYNKYELTAAHKTLPFGTIVKVRSLALGREVNVRINDRGPFAPGRVIDVSQAAAEALGLVGGAGVTEVSLNVADGTALEDTEEGAPQRKSRAKAPDSAPAKGDRHSKTKAHAAKDGAKAHKSKDSAKAHASKDGAKSHGSHKDAAAKKKHH